LLEDINKLGTAMYDIGLNGKRVAIIGRNRYEWVLAHLSNLLGGIVSVPLDKDLQYEELESSLIRSKADAIVFDEKIEDKISQIKENGKTNLKKYICMSKKESYISIYELINKGEELLKDNQNEYVNSEIDENNMNILLFTSGTTSKSKAVMLSQKNICANVMDLARIIKFDSNDSMLALLPFHHAFQSIINQMLQKTNKVYSTENGIRAIFGMGSEYFDAFGLSKDVSYSEVKQVLEIQGYTCE